MKKRFTIYLFLSIALLMAWSLDALAADPGYSAKDMKIGDYVAWHPTRRAYYSFDGGFRGPDSRSEEVDLINLGKARGFNNVTNCIVGVIIFVYPEGTEPGDVVLENFLFGWGENNNNIKIEKTFKRGDIYWKSALGDVNLAGIYGPDGKKRHAYIINLYESPRRWVYSEDYDNIYDNSCYPKFPDVRPRDVRVGMAEAWDSRGGYISSWCEYEYKDISSTELYSHPERGPWSKKDIEREDPINKHGKWTFHFSFSYSHCKYVLYQGYDLKQKLLVYNSKRGTSHRIKPMYTAENDDKDYPLVNSSGWFVPTAKEISCATWAYSVNKSLVRLAKYNDKVKPLRKNQNYWTIQEVSNGKAMGWYFDGNWIFLDKWRKKDAEFWIRTVAVL